MRVGRIYAVITRALMHLATTAWLACLPPRCVPASRLAYSSGAAGKQSPHPPRLAIVMPADVPLWKVNRRRPHVDELNRARKAPVFFWLAFAQCILRSTRCGAERGV